MTDSDSNIEVTRQWHAGSAGCGRLIAGVAHQVSLLKVGEILSVTALDAAAWIDLPAWCRMTGHELITETHPCYLIRKNPLT